MSIEQCYVKALLLGGLHANQLRQEDLLQVFEYMPEWCCVVCRIRSDGVQYDPSVRYVVSSSYNQ